MVALDFFTAFVILIFSVLMNAVNLVVLLTMAHAVTVPKRAEEPVIFKR